MKPSFLGRISFFRGENFGVQATILCPQAMGGHQAEVVLEHALQVPEGFDLMSYKDHPTLPWNQQLALVVFIGILCPQTN